MSSDSTPRLALPMLQPGQAQKELYHNEALALIDIAVQAVVLSVGSATPPTAPVPGQCWIVGTGASGAWHGADHHLAGWTEGGWRFVAPRDGMAVWSLADGGWARFADGSWTIGDERCRRILVDGEQVVGARRSAIAMGIGGSVVDAEARTAIAAILAALSGHGLIAS